MQQENERNKAPEVELSEVWQELLGNKPSTPLNGQEQGAEDNIPLLESDPWSVLSHDKGIEVVDLQEMQLHMSDQDVEQVLQVMQEIPEQDADQPPSGSSSSKP